MQAAFQTTSCSRLCSCHQYFWPGEYQTSTAAQSMKQKWASHICFPVLDTLLGKCSIRFSLQSMAIAKHVDVALKCDHRGAEGLLSQTPKLALTEMAMVTTSVSTESF